MLAGLALFLAAASVGPTPQAPPILGLRASDLHDSFEQLRGAGRHEAIDIMEPRGTPVYAVAPGTIAKLFLSKRGGNTIYLFDDAREFCYYYAHLDHYAPGLRDGVHVSAGQVVGFVGSSGDASADAPHLHFAIFELGPQKQWWKGAPIDPYPALMRLLKMG